MADHRARSKRRSDGRDGRFAFDRGSAKLLAMESEEAVPPDRLIEVPRVIRARSERQAMDWSLVLVSQGIEVALDREPTGNAWNLLVAPADHRRSLTAIRQFRLENRGFQWRHELAGSGLMFHWGVLLWVFAVAMCFQIQGHLEAGLFVSDAVRAGGWWRAFTAVWLHADLGHLASNVAVGTLFIGLAMARYPAGVALLGALLAGAGGNGFGLAFRPGGYIGLGASGLVMGALGMLAAQAVPLWRAGRPGTKAVLTGMGTGSLLFVLLGVDPSSDVLVHAGGFLGGGVAGASAAFIPDGRRAIASRISAVLFAAVVATTWVLALR
jgi:rhomboid protease GluP